MSIDATPSNRTHYELEGITGIGPELARALAARGIETLGHIREASDNSLLGTSGIGPARLRQLRALAGE